MSTGQNGRTIEIVASPTDVARRAADLFVEAFDEARAHGVFRVALSGGSTPRAFHTLLAQPDYRDRVDWSLVEFYWGDERCVPPDDPESNYRMARETLLERVPARQEQIHRMPGEVADVEAAAAQYEQELRASFHLEGNALPRFDLIYLGMGPDGHTASLFPHTAALHVRDRLVVANYVPKLNANRITLTLPALNNAARVAFVVAGADKANALQQVLEGERDPEEYPSQSIAPTNGTLVWICDEAAAGRLERQ